MQLIRCSCESQTEIEARKNKSTGKRKAIVNWYYFHKELRIPTRNNHCGSMRVAHDLLT